MREQKQFENISIALDRLEVQFAEWAKEQFRDQVSLVEYAGRLRTLKGRIEAMDKQASMILKPRLVTAGGQCRGERCMAILTVYQREGFDHKSMKESVPEKVWVKYVTYSEVESVTFKVL